MVSLRERLTALEKNHQRKKDFPAVRVQVDVPTGLVCERRLGTAVKAAIMMRQQEITRQPRTFSGPSIEHFPGENRAPDFVWITYTAYNNPTNMPKVVVRRSKDTP